ncbi:MAG: hypothetical protein FWF94_08825 [Oscillospiraceae bacterium]|nr:hypothetical protein [Oscillospiraceae bacterium]
MLIKIIQGTYNGVFNGKALIDVDTEAVTFYVDVPQWKEANGITSKTQVLCFPLVSRGGKTFRMSTHMTDISPSFTEASGC